MAQAQALGHERKSAPSPRRQPHEDDDLYSHSESSDFSYESDDSGDDIHTGQEILNSEAFQRHILNRPRVGSFDASPARGIF